MLKALPTTALKGAALFCISLCSVTALAQIVITPIHPLCIGSSVSLIPFATPPGGTWSGTGVSGSTFTANLNPGTYTITYTLGANSATTPIGVILKPSISPNGTVNMCPDLAPIQYTGTPTGGTWASPANATGLVVWGAGPGGPVAYNYTDQGGGTCSSGPDAIVNFWSFSLGGIEPAGPFCVNDAPGTITAYTSMSGGSMSGTGITGQVNGGGLVTATFDPSMAGVGSHVISLNTQSPGNCSATYTTTVVVSDCSTLSMTVHTDAFGSETSWEVMPQGSSTPVCSGNGYGNNATTTRLCPVADGCYKLHVYDGFGDGIIGGGYTLSMYGKDIIIANGRFASESYLPEGFCVPLGPTHLKDANCTASTLSSDARISCKTVSGATNYQFWFFDPHDSYSRRVLKTTNSMRLNSLPSNPIPTDFDLNVRVRAKVGGVFTAFGKTCELRRSSTSLRDVEASTIVDDDGAALLVYPNPANGEALYVRIMGQEGSATADVQLFDATGRMVHTEQFLLVDGSADQALDLRGRLAPGAYLVRTQCGNDQLIGHVNIAQ